MLYMFLIYVIFSFICFTTLVRVAVATDYTFDVDDYEFALAMSFTPVFNFVLMIFIVSDYIDSIKRKHV